MAFVKFSRGLISTYNSLNRKDPDTLYLVYENENSDKGSLYLGTKLISSVTNGEAITSLGGLSDVSLPAELEDGMLLQYNATTSENGVWEAVPLNEIISSIDANLNNISIVDALNEISNPHENDLAVINTNLYIYDGNEWIQLTDTDLKERISTLENNVGHAAQGDIPASGLYADIAAIQTQLGNIYTKSEVAEQIAAAQHLRYKIISNIDDIDVNSDEATYTIYLVPKQDFEINNGYDEYFVINNALEKIGDWDVDLSNYIQTDDDRLLTQDQKSKLEAITLNENNQVIIDASQVGNLIPTIKDNQLIKKVQVGTFNVTEEGELQLASVPSIDLSNYVQKTLYYAEVGDLSQLENRISNDSSLVDEINAIKSSLLWQELTNQSNNG